MHKLWVDKEIGNHIPLWLIIVVGIPFARSPNNVSERRGGLQTVDIHPAFCNI